MEVQTKMYSMKGGESRFIFLCTAHHILVCSENVHHKSEPADV